MMEKFKELLQKKAKEGKFVNDAQDMKARLETIAGMEDVAQEAFGAKVKGMKERSYPAQGATKDPKLAAAKSEDMKIGKSEEEVPHDSKDIPSEVQSEDESPDHEDAESAENEVRENQVESDMAKKNKDRKQYVK